MQKLFYFPIDKLISISSPTSTAILQNGFHKDRLVLIYNGINTKNVPSLSISEQAEFRRSYSIRSRDPIIVMAGMLTEWKGQDVLLRAVPDILGATPDCKIIFVGEPPNNDTAFRSALATLTDDLGIQESVRFIGYRRDVLALMAMADIVVHTSVAPEPFGRVIVEAMAAGTIILATNIGGPKEIIRHGHDGYLVEPNNPAALAERVNSVLANPDAASKMVAAGLESVKCFDSERVADRLDREFRDTIERKQKGRVRSI
jgi:glycosyltransferase involved in cell wall biosynthesis